MIRDPVMRMFVYGEGWYAFHQRGEEFLWLASTWQWFPVVSQQKQAIRLFHHLRLSLLADSDASPKCSSGPRNADRLLRKGLVVGGGEKGIPAFRIQNFEAQTRRANKGEKS